ncbi:MAG: hypothetical protein ACI399_01635 [Candidatus Cryptobacteroides sp.]
MIRHFFRAVFCSVLLTLSAIPALRAGTVRIGPLPWTASEAPGTAPAFLYLEGGFLSTDKGCPDWGTSDPRQIRFIGDRFGELVVEYADGTSDQVPLVLGYTLWMHGIWNENPAPFKGQFADEKCAQTLRRCLHVAGAFEGNGSGLLKIRLSGKPVSSIKVVPDPGKDAVPVFTGGWLSEQDASAEGLSGYEDFFAGHLVKAGARVPKQVAKDLGAIGLALHTFDRDFRKKPLEYAGTMPDAPSIRFSGNRLADIATSVVLCNIANLCARTDEDGMIHTSYKDAPSWRYDGFGPYVMNANSYYDSFYSRDASRAIMTLAGFNYTGKAAAACRFGNKWMMYYPEQGLTLGGKLIPGHFSVIPNKPLIYSTVLTKLGVPALSDDPDGGTMGGWPTRYTKKRFGDECDNLGNQETDGHGLMMMANWVTWKALGGGRKYVADNWEYIEEAAKWIVWCFDNPELSFVRDNLLYGETEAAMNTYSMYANVPCCLGLLCYSEMASAVGRDDLAAQWTEYSNRLREGIDAGFTVENRSKWDSEHFGFFHDPVPAMASDIYGYDLADIPQDWLERSRNTFDEDLEKTVAHGWLGVNGLGYNHSMMTQNALLLDRMDAAGKLLESLSRICYSPRLPEPYLVPEGASVDVGRGIWRRQGDLGNLVQLAEVLKCYLIVAGISPVHDGVLKIMPRLPKGWKAGVESFPVQNSGASIDLKVGRPSGARQSIEYRLSNPGGISEVAVRFGPFRTGRDEAKVKLNGKKYRVSLTGSGDSKWGWLKVCQ